MAERVIWTEHDGPLELVSRGGGVFQLRDPGEPEVSFWLVEADLAEMWAAASSDVDQGRER